MCKLKAFLITLCLLVSALASRVGVAADFTGVWKRKCTDFYGVQVVAVATGMYSVTFCGLKDCSVPGTWAPNTAIVGDPSYKVVAPDRIGIERHDEKGKYFMYKRCSTDPTWLPKKQ